MPLYTWTCTGHNCGRREDDICPAGQAMEPRECSTCGVEMEREMPRPVKPRVFEEGYYEHAGPEPVYCRTAQELQDACNRNGGVSVHLENSTHKVRRNYDAFAEKQETEREFARKQRHADPFEFVDGGRIDVPE